MKGILAPDGTLARDLAVRNNWYEASRVSVARSFIWEPVQSANKDLDRYTRQELSRHARYLWKNSPLIRGVVERIVTLICGSGFFPTFKSSDPKWNLRAKETFRRISRNIHLGPRCSFTQYQRALVRARIVDGEAFTVLTADDSVTYTSRVQGLESDRVFGFKKEIPAGPIDGFNLNHQGIPVSYNVGDVGEPYDAEFLIHHYTPNRLGQYRGETTLAACINTGRDVKDILDLEKECVRDASSKKDIIKTASGQLDAETFRSLRFGSASTNVTPFGLPADDGAKDDYYRIRFGAQPVVLKKGDEYTPYEPKRPGAAWQGFMDFLSQTICLSSGFPPSVILPVSIGGTDVRRDLDVAQKVADPIQLDIIAELDSIVDYLIESEIADGDLREGCPSDWRTKSWQCPPKVNVDRAQAQQDREDVSRGLMSLEEYHGRYGENAGDVEATVIEEAKRRKANIAAAGFKDVKEFVQIISLDSKMFQVAEPKQGQPPV